MPSIDGKVCHVPWSSPRPELLPHSVITHPSNLCAKFSEISLASSISMPTFEAPSVAWGIPEGEPERDGGSLSKSIKKVAAVR